MEEWSLSTTWTYRHLSTMVICVSRRQCSLERVFSLETTCVWTGMGGAARAAEAGSCMGWAYLRSLWQLQR
ncbi:hypothetical protein J4Q44_G00294680 [Coregonus suidteri]|uniref:Uncharacterized protein n=1 Tax=Coregonus suidteri TaxID=861788 RepID=A0AAN8QEA6_9TELE